MKWYFGVGQTLLWAFLYYTFPAFILGWENSFEWQRTEVSLGLMLAIIVRALLSPVAGKIIDKGYGREVLAGGALLGGFGLLALSFVSTLYQFYFVWIILGVAMAASLYDSCFAYVMITRPEQGAKIVTLITLFAGFASTLCFTFSAFLLKICSIQEILWIFSVIVIFCATPCMYLGTEKSRPIIKSEEEPKHSEHAEQKTKSHTFLQPIFLLFALGIALLSFCHATVITHLFPLLNEWKVESATVLLVASAIGPMQVFGRVAFYGLGEKLNVVSLSLFSFLGMIVGGICLYLSQTHYIFLLPFVLFQGASFGILSIIKPLVQKEITEDGEFGFLGGLVALPSLVLSAIAPFLAAILWSIGSYNFVVKVCVVSSIIATLCYLGVLLLHRGKQSKTNSSVVVANK